jgi:hypothetical protein
MVLYRVVRQGAYIIGYNTEGGGIRPGSEAPPSVMSNTYDRISKFIHPYRVHDFSSNI